MDSSIATPGLSHGLARYDCSVTGANQFHLGLKAIPSRFLSFATKNLEPHKKVIRIKTTTQHRDQKVPSVVDS